MTAHVLEPISLLDAGKSPTRQSTLEPGTYQVVTIVNPFHYGTGNWLVIVQDGETTRLGASREWWELERHRDRVIFSS